MIAIGCQVEVHVAPESEEASTSSPVSPTGMDRQGAGESDTSERLDLQDGDATAHSAIHSTDEEPVDDDPEYMTFEEQEALYRKLRPDISTDWVRLSKDQEVWLDKEQKRVVAGGFICLEEGILEMFACPAGTKEHESIVAVKCSAEMIHVGLLAVGAEPGHPVRFYPEYEAAAGPVVQIDVSWKEGDQLVTRRAQEMVRQSGTKEAMKNDWVYAGSEIYEAPGLWYFMWTGSSFARAKNISWPTLEIWFAFPTSPRP